MPCLPIVLFCTWNSAFQKAKVVVVSPVPAPAVTFSCNGNSIEQIATFKYSGLHFHPSSAVLHLISPIKSKPGSSWAAVQQRHSLLQCGRTVMRLAHIPKLKDTAVTSETATTCRISASDIHTALPTMLTKSLAGVPDDAHDPDATVPTSTRPAQRPKQSKQQQQTTRSAMHLNTVSTQDSL